MKRLILPWRRLLPALLGFALAPTCPAAMSAARLWNEENLAAIRIDQRYPLADVVRAHHDLESRRNTGSSVLLP